MTRRSGSLCGELVRCIVSSLHQKMPSAYPESLSIPQESAGTTLFQSRPNKAGSIDKTASAGKRLAAQCPWRRRRDGDGFCDTDAVNSGRHDAAGIACAFAGGVQPGDIQALRVVVAAFDAYWRTGARFDRREHRIRHEKPGIVLSKGR